MNPQAMKSSKDSNLYHITRHQGKTFCGYQTDDYVPATENEQQTIRWCERCVGTIDHWLTDMSVSPRNLWENLEFV